MAVYPLIPLIPSPLVTQKCLISVDYFRELNCSLGTAVRLETNEGKFLCKLYPRQMEEHFACFYENTVEIYDQRKNKILSRHTLCKEKESLTILQCNTAAKVTVTVITGTFEGTSALKKCRLAILVRDLLLNRAFTKFSSINVTNIASCMDICNILILNVEPSGEAFSISRKTEVVIEAVITRYWFLQQSKISTNQIGGLNSEIEKLKNLIIYPLNHPKVFSELCTSKGILLHGPSGTGKTEAVHYLCHNFGLYLATVNSSDFTSSLPGENENKLKAIFKEVEENSRDNPTILFFDDIDSMCPRRGNYSHPLKLLPLLTTLLESMDLNVPLRVIAATSRPEDIDPALRRPLRLDEEICFYVPNLNQRKEILEVHCRKLEMRLQCSLEEVAMITPGYVGADLCLLCNEVVKLSAERCRVTYNDFKEATSRILPSTLRHSQGSSDFRKVSWDEVGGLQQAQVYLQRSIEWPIKRPEIFANLKIPRPKGILIYGPPGCGKSMLVRAAATSCAASFLSVSAAELFSPFVGDSEKNVTALFNRARMAVPCILFLDELDAMVGSRSTNASGRTAQLGVISTLLQEMDGILSCQGVVVVGATNRPDKIDGALLRPGRFDSLVYIRNPDHNSRVAILKAITRKMAVDAIDFEKIASLTPRFSGADFESLCKEAGLLAMEENLDAVRIQEKHFLCALSEKKPSLSADQVSWYERYAAGE